MRTGKLPVTAVHTRRIVLDDLESDYLAYCTVCAWYQQGSLEDTTVAWAEHLEKLIAARPVDLNPFLSDAPYLLHIFNPDPDHGACRVQIGVGRSCGAAREDHIYQGSPATS